MIGKIKLVVIALSIMAICACRKKSEPLKIPANVMPPDSMLMVLTDIHLIEGARVGNRIQGNDSLNIKDYYHHVWDKYHLSKERFRRSFNFYSTHPDEMSELYRQMLDSLSIMEANLKGSGEEEEKEEEDGKNPEKEKE